MLLAIDTSTDTASLALAQDSIVLTELTWRSKQNHTTQLLPNLNYLFGLIEANVKSLTAVIVAQGPGSFNGLRVGVSAAKGTVWKWRLTNTRKQACPFALFSMPVGARLPPQPTRKNTASGSNW